MYLKIAIHTITISMLGLLFGCASPSLPRSEIHDQLIGCWYGEEYQPALQRRAGWLMNRKQDGTFIVEFRTVESGHQLPIQVEEGCWTYRDGKYITKTIKVAGGDVEYTDEYDLQSLNENDMTYYHPVAKQTFKSKRVSCDYKAP